MLDAYSSVGMPLMYRHWSFGKHFIHHERLYRRGARGLAYEIVINSNPCISYCLEENTIALQALVMAHAAFGHNHFFKTNHLFRQWTDPDGILDYLEYARGYIQRCEERHGHGRGGAAARRRARADAGERLPPPPPAAAVAARGARARAAAPRRGGARRPLPLGRAARPRGASPAAESEMRERKRAMHLPEENLLSSSRSTARC